MLRLPKTFQLLGGGGVNIHCLGSLINNIDSCHRLLITNCFIIYMYGIATYATT